MHCSLFSVQYLFARVNGTWRRAEIKKVMDRSVIIFCVDYGHTTTVKCHDLRPAIGKVLSPLCGLKLLFRMDSLLTDQIMLSYIEFDYKSCLSTKQLPLSKRIKTTPYLLESVRFSAITHWRKMILYLCHYALVVKPNVMWSPSG